MIHRKRPKNAPPSLCDCKTCNGKGCPGESCGSTGARELAKVLAWIEKKRSEDKKLRPDFKAYRSPDVVAALEALFHRKCAYCESPYGPVHPVDVEHWRPKSEVDTVGTDGKKQLRFGYEWLAMKWDNLLPSCIDCNRARRQFTPEGKEVLMGKANLFPVRDEARRYTSPADTHDEEPLLLNPCEDKPEAFFNFGQDGVLLSRKDIPLAERERAAESIRVYGLNRRSLVDERARHLRWLELEFRVIRFLFDASGNPSVPEDVRKIATDLFRQTLDRLLERLETHQPYSAFIAQRLRPFLSVELGAQPAVPIAWCQTDGI